MTFINYIGSVKIFYLLNFTELSKIKNILDGRVIIELKDFFVDLYYCF